MTGIWDTSPFIDRTISSSTHPPAKALAIGLAALVLPAWKWYILPMLHGVDHPKAKQVEEAPRSGRPRVFGRIGSSMSLGDEKGKGKLSRRFSTFSREGSMTLVTA